MVLESLINPIKAEKTPWKMFFIGFLYSSVALFLSFWIFEKYSSLVMVFLTVLALTPLMYATIKYEEKKDLIIEEESKLLKEHARALTFFIFLFMGVTLSYAFWYVVLPMDLVSTIFSVQTETISEINGRVTGNISSNLGTLSTIFLNNFKVMIFCVLFAFIYGLGAIFILVWNASVIGVAIGSVIRSGIAYAANFAGFTKIALYMKATTIGIMKYFIHGIPEILGYFIAGLAGGIISVAVIRHDFGTKKFERILLDSSDLIILAIVVLVIAAFIEVYITPVLF